eukprot:TRINITY_DN54545_c0_g1_i1.p1 TRINITY_DN54545_c0_g1~~TRINITY_DN54545_c0_g1_i1.p1  ORF type:complete len:113 (+),score=3.51 TRINITY_DN54545_c0_g1_i1:218-556(+)
MHALITTPSRLVLKASVMPALRALSTMSTGSKPPMVPEERFYPEWVDAILNREDATGPRKTRHTKRMRLRQRQREGDHKRRIAQTKASQQDHREKLWWHRQEGLKWEVKFKN